MTLLNLFWDLVDYEENVPTLCRVAHAFALVGDMDGTRKIANQAFTVAEAIGDKRFRAEALHQVTQVLALVEASDHTVATAVVATDAMSNAPVLGEAVKPLVQAEQQEEAWHALCAAFTEARPAGRSEVFEVLQDRASALAALDQGQTLWQVYEAVMEVDSWWS
jgi:hypothetical protein